MGIYGALATSVSGLRAQSTALANISGNIANSQTTGYKRMETSFLDLIPDAAVGRQVPGAIQAQTRSTNEVRGDIITSPTGTHIAQNGSGFFTVAEKTGTTDGQSTFGATDFYTRRGDFELDREGFLVNGSGYYLKGVPLQDGNIAGSVPEMIEVGNGLLPAKASSTLNYELNLPNEPTSEPLRTDYPDPADPGAFDWEAFDNDTFMEQTIDGGAITVYADNGAAANMQMRWGRVPEDTAADTPEKWQLFYLSDSQANRWTPVEEGQMQFGADGTLDTYGAAGEAADPDTATRIAFGDITVEGVAIEGVQMNFGASGITQFSDPNGTAKVNQLSQNGYPAGDFASVAVNDSGRVVASYSNGEQIDLYQVVTANFNAENMLKRMDGGVYQATAQSGEAIVSFDGSISGGALETSNTDISEEFTKLITTQQAYAAGTRIVSTSDEMLQEALNMVR